MTDKANMNSFVKRSNQLQSFSINRFVILIGIALLGTMAANAKDIIAFRIITYVSEMMLILYALFFSFFKYRIVIINIPICIVSILLCLNYILSPNMPNYTDLIKFFGYFVCFWFGNSLARHYNGFHLNKKLLWAVILTPALLVGFFDKTNLKDLFFANSNVFVYLGLSMALFYYFLYRETKWGLLTSWLILFIYVAVGTSLGIIVAVLLSLLLLFFRKSFIIWLFLGGVILSLSVLYIDIPIFIRIRDVFAVWGAMDASDWTDIENLDLYELGNRVSRTGERSDTTSSIWRLAHWIVLISDYIKSLWNIPFGFGSGYSLIRTGLRPHNDFLLILVEYGLVVFCYFITFIKRIWKGIDDKKIMCFIVAMYCYHLTENLIDSFVPNSLLYFAIGYLLLKSKRPNSGQGMVLRN